MKYFIVADCGITEIQNKVEVLLGNGWRCQGGIFVLQDRPEDGGRMYFYQAMIRD